MGYFMIFSPSQLKELQSLIYFSGPKIYASQMSNRKYARMCEQSALKLLSNTIRIILTFLISCSIPAIFTMFILIRDHELDLPIPVIFPFTDLNSTSGLTINFINQVYIATVGIASNVGIEIIVCLVKNTVWMMTVGMRYAIDEVIEKLTSFPMTTTLSIDYSLRNILLQAQDFDRYLYIFTPKMKSETFV